MNVELVDSETLMKSTVLLASGKGADIQEAVALLLRGKEAYKQNPNAKGGKNCSLLLSKALKSLHDDPLLALGLDATATPEEAAIKKNYHKLALKYHPDKNKDTGLLFQAAHSAYNLLMDQDKRVAWERKRKKQDESLEQLRRRKEEEQAKKASTESQQPPNNDRKASSASSSSASSSSPTPPGSSSSTAGDPPQRRGSTNSFNTENPIDAAEEKLREFNKKFYNEFRKVARKGAFNAGGGAAAAGGAGAGGGSTSDGGRPQAPPRPKGLRSTARTETSITLEWNSCTTQGTVAYELQWRERGQSEQQWQTSQQLILGAMCLKKNLKSGVCYEFRVRAASAWGWSSFSDPIMVLTAGASSASDNSTSRRESSTEGQSSDRSKAEKPRRQSKAADEATSSSPWTWSDGQDIPSQAAAGLWVCAVCRRENPGATDTCAVCFTKKDYKPQKLNNISPTAARAYPTSDGEGGGGTRAAPPNPTAEDIDERRKRNARHPARSGSTTSAREVETDEEAAEDAWEYSEADVDDLPPQEVEESPEGSGLYDDEGGEGQDQIYRLNIQVTKLHNVRAEPIKTAEVVGHIFADRDVIVQAEVGPWLKVVWHQAYSDEKSGGGNTSSKKQSQSNGGTGTTGTGWCLKDHQGVRYLVRAENPARPYAATSETSHRKTKSSASSGGAGASYVQQAQERVSSPQQQHEYAAASETEPDQDVWYELKDENGDVYYFNTATGSSQWEPPIWWDEIDPASGAVYYRNNLTGITQWEKPEGFAPVIRAESYSTPEAEFVKSMLSPHRSFRNQGKTGAGGGGGGGKGGGTAFSFEPSESGVIK